MGVASAAGWAGGVGAIGAAGATEGEGPGEGGTGVGDETPTPMVANPWREAAMGLDARSILWILDLKSSNSLHEMDEEDEARGAFFFSVALLLEDVVVDMVLIN